MSHRRWVGVAQRVKQTVLAASRSLASLTPGERAAGLEAFLTLISTSVAMRFSPNSTLARTIAPPASRVTRHAISNDTQFVCRMMTAVARDFVMPARCLNRSLALAKMLRRRGIASRVVVGIRYDDAAIHGHAWIECDGLPLVDSPEISSHFTPLSPSALERYTSRDGFAWSCR